MIVWLASYPRSGNTLYRLLLHQICGWDTYSVYNDVLLANSGVGKLLGQKELDKHRLDVQARSSMIHFIKTHGHDERDTDGTAPVIYIVRDPRDAIVSYAHYRKDIERAPGSYEHHMADVITRKLWLGWDEHVKYWTDRPKCKALSIVRFEDMLQWPIQALERSLFRIGMKCPVNRSVKPTQFAELQRKWPWFFRKGKVGSWRTEMPKDIETMLWNRYGTVAGMMGYVR